MRGPATALGVMIGVALASPACAWNAVRCVESQLNLLGYRLGPADGYVDPLTRWALARYEQAEGPLTARIFDPYSAIVYCRQIGLRHEVARMLWPSRDAAYAIHADDSVLRVYRDGVMLGLNRALAELDGGLGVKLAGRFDVYIGQSVKQIMALSDANPPSWVSRAEMLSEVEHICSFRWTRGVSLPGVIVICRAPTRGTDFGTPLRDAIGLARHEVFHEVQYQLSGDFPYVEGVDPVQHTGPFWLIEGSAVVFENGPVVTERANGARLVKFEKWAAASDAGPSLYILGEGAARALAKRGRGLAGIVAFYDLIGKGVLWPEAFEQVFGVTVNDFYAGK